MNTTAETPQNTAKQFPWTRFTTAKKNWLQSISNDAEITSRIEESSEREESQAEQLVSSFLAALSPSPERFLSRENDLEIMKKALSSIYEAMKENVLSESEANALVEHLMAKFIERRFGIILRNVFDVETAQKYAFRGFQGKLR